MSISIAGNSGVESVYSTESWIQDAGMVKAAWSLTHDDELYPDILPLLKDTDKTTANAVLRLTEPNIRQEIEARSLQAILKPTSSINAVQAFTNFIERFRKGPNHYNSPEPSRAGSIRPSVERTPAFNNPGPVGGHGGPPERDHFNPDPADRPYRAPSERSERPHRRHNPSLYERPNPSLIASKVKASDLEYDSKTSVINYINKLEYIASTYRDSAILPLLPSVMKGAARTWFDSIFLSVRIDMNQSLVL